MASEYELVNWENYPSEKTPINATNLNHMDNQIKANADKLGEMGDNIEQRIQTLEEEISKAGAKVFNPEHPFKYKTCADSSGNTYAVAGMYDYRNVGDLMSIWTQLSILKNIPAAEKSQYGQYSTDSVQIGTVNYYPNMPIYFTCHLWCSTLDSTYGGKSANYWHLKPVELFINPGGSVYICKLDEDIPSGLMINFLASYVAVGWNSNPDYN